MVRRVRKNFTLPLDVVKRLEEEENQSEVVEEELRKRFDL